jgi:hypothetical protein
VAEGRSLTISKKNPIQGVAEIVALLQSEFGAVVEELDGGTSSVVVWLSVPVALPTDRPAAGS